MLWKSLFIYVIKIILIHSFLRDLLWEWSSTKTETIHSIFLLPAVRAEDVWPRILGDQTVGLTIQMGHWMGFGLMLLSDTVPYLSSLRKPLEEQRKREAKTKSRYYALMKGWSTETPGQRRQRWDYFRLGRSDKANQSRPGENWLCVSLMIIEKGENCWIQETAGWCFTSGQVMKWKSGRGN